MRTWKHGIAWPCLIIGTVVGLIFVEPDRGTAILMAVLARVAAHRGVLEIHSATGGIGLAGFALALHLIRCACAGFQLARFGRAQDRRWFPGLSPCWQLVRVVGPVWD